MKKGTIPPPCKLRKVYLQESMVRGSEFPHLPQAIFVTCAESKISQTPPLTCLWAKCCTTLVLERDLLQDSKGTVATSGSYSLYLDSSKPHHLRKVRRVVQAYTDFSNNYCCLFPFFMNGNKMLDCPWRRVRVNIWCTSLYTNVFLKGRFLIKSTL